MAVTGVPGSGYCFHRRGLPHVGLPGEFNLVAFRWTPAGLSPLSPGSLAEGLLLQTWP